MSFKKIWITLFLLAIVLGACATATPAISSGGAPGVFTTPQPPPTGTPAQMVSPQPQPLAPTATATQVNLCLKSNTLTGETWYVSNSPDGKVIAAAYAKTVEGKLLDADKNKDATGKSKLLVYAQPLCVLVDTAKDAYAVHMWDPKDGSVSFVARDHMSATKPTVTPTAIPAAKFIGKTCTVTVDASVAELGSSFVISGKLNNVVTQGTTLVVDNERSSLVDVTFLAKMSQSTWTQQTGTLESSFIRCNP